MDSSKVITINPAAKYHDWGYPLLPPEEPERFLPIPLHFWDSASSDAESHSQPSTLNVHTPLDTTTPVLSSMKRANGLERCIDGNLIMCYHRPDRSKFPLIFLIDYFLSDILNPVSSLFHRIIVSAYFVKWLLATTARSTV